MTLTLYSFGDHDRSGKVRWTAAELGIPVDEKRVDFAATRAPAYREKSPFGVVPVVEHGDRLLRESTAICQLLAEEHPEAGLVVLPGDPDRAAFLIWISTFAETLESKLVECAISKAGIIPSQVFDAIGPRTGDRLRAIAAQIPSEGYLVGERFTLADIVAAYSVRLGIQTGLLERELVEPWLSRLIERPAATQARFFDGLA